MKIYESEVVFSEAAVRLLHLSVASPYVLFMVDRDAEQVGRKRLYVARATGTWPIRYPSVPKGKRRIVRCRELSRQLALGLDGYGTYRVCGEDSWTDKGITWYNIFFRRYDSEDSIRRHNTPAL